MADLIIQLPELHSEIEQQKMLMLLPDKSLEWVTQSKRQHNWICRRIIEKGNYFPIDLPPNLTGRDLAISTIDIWATNQQSKYTEVLELSSAWTVQEKADQAFQWFYGKDEEKKCELAWRVLDKKFPNLATTNNQFKNHEELLSFIDRNPPSDSDVELFIKSVKSQWSQKKYREKQTGKKQYNFILSDKAIKRLNKLADKYDMKRAQILEILLQMEDEKGIYIPERIKILMDT